jgi:two-component system OmpR family sensor kinase
VASPASSIRSAARATSSAYRRLPIRWRLAGGSAALTLVILCGFATIVGVLTDRRLHQDFSRQVAAAADDLQRALPLKRAFDNEGRPVLTCATNACPISNLTDYASPQDAVVRIVARDGSALKESRGAPNLPSPFYLGRSADFGGYRVETRRLAVTNYADPVFVQYARRLSDVDATAGRVRFFLALGVLGGAALALLAGLATARRAMSPIAQLTEAARNIARTRDPSVRLPRPTSNDEVAELADTLGAMLHSLDESRGETEAALARQREFVADASHELRTPLTSVLANLELLEEELGGEQRETAASALRSTRRMRRLVADLLLLARADAGREAPQGPVDLGEVVVEAAAELEPVARGHELTVDAPRGAVVLGTRDELHRLVLNLMENAVKHTEPGTPIRASVRREGDDVVLVVEDEGPGVPEELADKVFERFVRGGADRAGSSGLGLSIVRAVAETHGGSVGLQPSSTGGARFVVRLPSQAFSPVDKVGALAL